MIGVGVDVSDVARFERLLGRGARGVWDHWYTADELDICALQSRPAEAAATRFAVKEATFKAIGARFTSAIRWREIEVLGDKPTWCIRLHGEIADAAAAAGVGSIHASTCRTGNRVVAMVVAEAAGTTAIAKRADR